MVMLALRPDTEVAEQVSAGNSLVRDQHLVQSANPACLRLARLSSRPFDTCPENQQVR